MKKIKETWTNSYPPTREGKIQKDIIEKALFSTVASGYSVTGKIDDYIIYIKDLSGNNDSSLRIGGTISSSIFAMLQGVQMLRVHDVNEVNQAIKVFKALINK